MPEARPEGAAEAPVLFVSYSHRDDHWMRKLRVHLTPLKRKRECEVIPWDDSEIEPGAGWAGAIDGAIGRARAAILLVSGNYIASEFITTQELPRLFEAARTRGLQIFWVLISPCLYRTYPELQATQAFHDPSRPLVGMPEVQVEDVLSRLAEAAGEAARVRPEADEAEPERPVVELAPEPLLDSHPSVLRSLGAEPVYRGEALASVYGTIVPMAFENLPISEVVSPPEEDWGLSDTLPRASQLPKIVVTFAGVAKLLDWARDLWKALVGAILENDTVRNFLLALLLLFSGFLPPVLVARARKGKIAGQHLLGLFLGLGALGLVATAAGAVLGLKEGSP